MPAIILFIKNPVHGKVKTRIAATAGHDRALQIYQALLARTRQEALKVEANRYVFYHSHIEPNDDWQEPDFIKKVQRGKDIGERMSNAFVDIMPPHDRAVLIGGDIAEIKADIISEALDRLNNYDFVLGPARDGGYYLIGMKEPQPAVFEDIPWSNLDTASATVKRIRRHLGRTCYLLPTLSDIDSEKDWEKYGWEI